MIAVHALRSAGIIDRVCWVVPRDSLRLQAEEAFADSTWRVALGHAVTVRAADNAPDPSRGLHGYITTYQSVAAAPDLHLAEFRRHRMLLVVDEVHHLPALSDEAPDPLADPAGDAATGWSRALLLLLETARLRLLLSGTLQRVDGRNILWLPYRRGPRAKTREVDLAAAGWAVVGYSRSQALAERAVLPVLFGAVDSEASWLAEIRVAVGPHRLFSHWPTETTRPALFTALRTGFADQLLREAFAATRTLRAERRRERELAPGEDAGGLGNLVVAPDQLNARRYAETVRVATTLLAPANSSPHRHRHLNRTRRSSRPITAHRVLLRRPHDRNRDLHALHPTAGATSTAAISRENDVVTRHGPIHLQIAALLRLEIPLAPDAANAVRSAIDRRRQRSALGVQPTHNRFPAGSKRMITPLSPTAPASSKPLIPYRNRLAGIVLRRLSYAKRRPKLITRADCPLRETT